MHRTPTKRSITSTLGLALVLVLVGGCTDTRDSGDVTTSSPDVTTTVPVDTIPETTVPETVPQTTIPEPATTVPGPPALVLRKSGIGPIEFGAVPADAIDAITAQLGAPVNDEVVNYTDFSLVDSGIFLSGDGVGFRYPVGREVCWLERLCVNLGGEAEALMSFVGWVYYDPAATLQSIEGVTIGSRWSDFPDMQAFAHCVSEGRGTINGIDLGLDSDGHLIWLTDAGETVLPDPNNTNVIWMAAGELTFYAEGECGG